MKSAVPIAMPRLVYAADRAGLPCASLAALLEPARVTAFVGGGGKTSTILTLAKELAASSVRVTVSTTTHILPVAGLPENISIVGTTLPDGRLGAVDDPARLLAECDFLLFEADGSRGLPVKAPASHEPALPDFAEKVVAVQGLTAFGQSIHTVCHRPALVAAILGKSEEDILTPEDGALLLMSELGQRKGVGARPYAVVLNQADGTRERALAQRILEQLPKDVGCAVTAYAQEEDL